MKPGDKVVMNNKYYVSAENKRPSLSLKEISKQELLNIISKTLCKDKADHDDRGE